jgi:hypothetical protein
MKAIPMALVFLGNGKGIYRNSTRVKTGLRAKRKLSGSITPPFGFQEQHQTAHTEKYSVGGFFLQSCTTQVNPVYFHRNH